MSKSGDLPSALMASFCDISANQIGRYHCIFVR